MTGLKHTSIKLCLIGMYEINTAKAKNNSYDKMEHLSLFDEYGSNSEPLGCIFTTQMERQVISSKETVNVNNLAPLHKGL